MSTGRDVLHAVKKSSSAHQPTLSIPIGHPIEAVLRPIGTVRESLRETDVIALTEWRNRYGSAFLTEFHATKERTERWLLDHVGNDETRLLFMVDDLAGDTIAYMGLAFIDWRKKSGEADAIVRGKATRPGFMTLALGTLLRWSRNQLGLQRLGVRVRSDNPALEFYQKFGFSEVRRVCLRRDDVDGETHLVPDDSLRSAQLQLVYMELKGDSWGN